MSICEDCDQPIELGFVDYSDTPGLVHIATGEALCDPDKEDSTDAVVKT